MAVERAKHQRLKAVTELVCKDDKLPLDSLIDLEKTINGNKNSPQSSFSHTDRASLLCLIVDNLVCTLYVFNYITDSNFCSVQPFRHDVFPFSSQHISVHGPAINLNGFDGSTHQLTCHPELLNKPYYTTASGVVFQAFLYYNFTGTFHSLYHSAHLCSSQ